MQETLFRKLNRSTRAQRFVRATSIAAFTLIMLQPLHAGGLKGRGGGGGGMARPSMGGGGGGMQRPSMGGGGGGMQRPSMGGGGGGGMQRPSMGGGGVGMQRPNVSRPSASPSIGNSLNRPNIGGSGGSMTRPAPGGSGQSRPNLGNSGSRPSAGMKPSTRPSIDLPSGGRPSIGSMPSLGNRPSTGSRPGTGNLPGAGNRPNLGDRPSVGDLPGFGGDRPGMTRPGTTLPGTTRPDITRPGTTLPGTTRPDITRPGTTLPGTTRPDITRPGTTLPGTTRPDVTRPGLTRPGTTLPGDLTRPNLPNRPDGITRPGITNPGAIARPLPGDVGDFLGIGKPIRPMPLPEAIDRPGIGDRPGLGRPGVETLPGIVDRPGGIGRPGVETLPGIVDRPGGIGRPGVETLPGIVDRPGGIDRPGIGNRPGDDRPITNRPINNRPIDWNNVNIGNTVINQRPSWVTINKNQFININNRWQNQLGGLHNWTNTRPGRLDFWNGWGSNVRHHWHHHGNCGSWFRPNWWNNHPHGWGAWHYGFWFHNRPWSYWWSVPTFNAFTSWFTWSAPQTVWAQPVFYDYGDGGNVTFNNNMVYINEQPVAAADEFAQSAAVLASVAAPKEEQSMEEVEWMALGTFTIATDEKDLEPTRVIQLAVNRQGIVSGTMFNTETDKAHAVQGRVDKDTQRVAFRIGESADTILETGLYNLTQPQAPVLVHFGTERVEKYLFVRLEAPEDEEAAEYAEAAETPAVESGLP